MNETISRRQLQRMMLPALKEGMADPAALLILADALSELEPAAAHLLRAHPDVWGVLCVLTFGCWRCKVVLRRWRSLIHRYAAACYRMRRDGVEHPEVDAVLSPELTILSDREVGGENATYGQGALVNALGRTGWERSLRHVRRLVDRGLSGCDVPPDIMRGLADLRVALQAALLDGGRWNAP